MVAEFYRTKNGSFILPKIIGIHFTSITKFPYDILLKKMPGELPSTEQIFAETSRLVPLTAKNSKQSIDLSVREDLLSEERLRLRV